MPKVKKLFFPLIILISLLANCNYSWAEDERRDGNWWTTQTRLSKLDYIIGFFDGMELGNKFPYWKIIHSNNKSDNKCFGKVYESYNEYSDKYFNHVTSGQIVDGLDSFYSDYKNRRLLVHDAVWLVVNGIAGISKRRT